MGSRHRRLINAAWASAFILVSVDAAWDKGQRKDVKFEDSGFWDRILVDEASSIASAAPSSAPSVVPSRAQTLPPVAVTSAPTRATTMAPVAVTFSPTAAPVAVTSAPTPAPITATIAPVIITSPPPSDSPTRNSAPTPSPTVVSSADPTLSGCFLNAIISCLDTNGIPCADLVPPSGQCANGTAIQVVSFFVTSRTCEESRNAQDGNFGCEQVEPLPQEGTAVNISCLDTFGNEFFSERTSIGSSVSIQDPIAGLPAEITCIVTGSALGNQLQIIAINTGGDVDLFLQDTFGMFELISCGIEGQPVQTCTAPILYTYLLENIGGVALNVTSLLRTRNNETVELFESIEGINPLLPGDSVSTAEAEVIDLCIDGFYETTIIAGADLEGGSSCEDAALYAINIENIIIPPIISPTAAPDGSTMPSQSPVKGTNGPTADPESAKCNVEASVSCAYGDGFPCDFQSPAGVTCLGTTATFLQFSYVPGSFCMGDNLSSNFECQDSNLDIERPESVYLRILGQDGVWFSQAVTEGQIIDVPTKSGDTMQIEISTVDDGGPGAMLQQSLINYDCTEESGLTLLNLFGNLQLVGFQNTEIGLQQVFADVVITYTATNTGRLGMNLFGAFGSSPFSGFQDFLNGEVRTLSQGDDAAFVEQFTLNLDATAGSDFQFTFLAQGRGPNSQVGCDDTDAFSLSIGV